MKSIDVIEKSSVVILNSKIKKLEENLEEINEQYY